MPVRVLALLVAAVVPLGVCAAATADPPGTPVVLHSGEVTRQDIASQQHSEADTTAEPDVAVNPTNPDNAIAVAHDSRYEREGAVDISYAWTTNGGKTWQHRPVRGITTATGGGWDRASDPVVTFAADGTAYLSVLEISTSDCRSGVAVLTTHNGGVSWSRPYIAHSGKACFHADDKDWIVVDNSPASPYFGRVYVFWTRLVATRQLIGSPQAVRSSDDQGRTWSDVHYVTDLDDVTSNSQPMIRADGTVVDTYYEFGAGTAPDATPGPRIINAATPIYASVSRDGGRTWSDQAEVVAAGNGYSRGVRCCWFGADIDPVTQRMYVAFEGGVGNTDPVYVSWSDTGEFWSSPVRVSQGDTAGVTRVNLDVVARAGRVYVTYGTRTDPSDNGGFVQQQLSTSTDRGVSFGAPMSIGPVSALRWAARSRGYFPGDYLGAAVGPHRLYVTFAVSSKPPASSSSPYHQVIWGVTLRT